MKNLLNLYVNPGSVTYGRWAASSLQAAITLERGQYCARLLHRMVRAYIADRTVLPVNPYGAWKTSMLCDQDLANSISLHLQELGKNISAQALVDFLARPDICAKHGINKPISLATAKRWLNTMGYRYRHEGRGQYTDGHERKDVVFYRDHIYIPRLKEVRRYVYPQTRERVHDRRTIIWYHDESIFYAHDRRKKSWYHKDAAPKPYKKGEGASLMIADFVSADYGWLRSPNGNESAREVFRPGANRDGYFTNDQILQQADKAAQLVTSHYPTFDHVFVYDNATTHRKRADDALSARHMPKLVSKTLEDTWYIQRNVIDPGTRRPRRNPDRTYVKERIRMRDTRNPKTGEVQSLYYPDDHELYPGRFKGMAQLLIERGWDPERLKAGGELKAECSSFKCADITAACCTRRILFNEPDFANVPSLLETSMEEYGISVLFLPKFHCELNPIEQCWGYAKRIYRLNPESSKEDRLEQNAIDALEQVPLLSIRRFFNRAHRFMDAYSEGLNGRQSAWACRKYKGHRTLPPELKVALEKAGMSS
ncbi:hypothetical protein EXIGLDRAFT_622608 [Exidia glandulosa HHB12029]|uniref:Tc1-like transposase DDE domain-containing protein n=1 Tax=Exidia glandulosa HHB12029 TaxID=1314781 RepID=A0A165E0B1_EXIGL|nr:hypothetical protein EXIGLDRAFT_622608 [Exidia glandulosa HHB12029]